MYFWYKDLYIHTYIYTLVLENIQLVVSRLFAGDNRLSPDILLVTTDCQQTKKSGDNRLSADLAILLIVFFCQPLD